MNARDARLHDGVDGVVNVEPRALAELDGAEAAPVTARSPAPPARGRTIVNPIRWGRTTRTPLPDGRAPNPLVSLARGFTAFVALPTAIVAVYLFVFASDQYVVEARFAVRGNVEQISTPGDSGGTSGTLSSRNNSQDGFIVQSYVESLPMVRAAEKALNISTLFSRGEADFWTRFDAAEPVEELVKYWRRHVTARIDALSGIITLETRAFTREDALAISRFVITRAEELVNEISRRAQEDTVRRNRDEVARAEMRLKAAHLQLQQFRNRWGIIDPGKSAEATLQTVASLRREKLKLENDLYVLRGSLDEKARSIQTIVATLEAMNQQIDQLQEQLTSTAVNAAGGTNVSQAILEYEGHVIERMVADKLYDSAQTMLDRSRLAADKQQVYLTTFVPPFLPEDSLYPRRWSTLFTLAFSFLVLWSIGALILAGVRDHKV